MQNSESKIAKKKIETKLPDTFVLKKQRYFFCGIAQKKTGIEKRCCLEYRSIL